MRRFPPEQIVYQTEETVETPCLLGEDRRIVGFWGYAVRPTWVCREKPRVSAFFSADIPKIVALEPDLVLAFSDIPADVTAEMMRAGITVMAYKQRDIAGIPSMIRHRGATIGEFERADRPAGELKRRLEAIAARAGGLFRGVE